MFKPEAAGEFFVRRFSISSTNIDDSVLETLSSAWHRDGFSALPPRNTNRPNRRESQQPSSKNQ
jgi:hypothetical protein